MNIFIISATYFAFLCFNISQSQDVRQTQELELENMRQAVRIQQEDEVQKPAEFPPLLRHHRDRLKKLLDEFRNKNLSEYLGKQNRTKIKNKFVLMKAETPLLDGDPFTTNRKFGSDDYLIMGDLLLSDEQIDSLILDMDKNKDPRHKRQISKIFSRWTNAQLNYYLDKSIDATMRKSINVAHAFIEERSCIRFVENRAARNRVRVYSGAGCFSSVGMLGGEQTLSLAKGCGTIGTVAHEFAHALGVWHTQMRSDRDNYVTIDLSVVNPRFYLNFAKLTKEEEYSVTPYEYGSFMHYSSDSFVNSYEQASIIPNDMDYAYTMGNRMISFYDIQMLNYHYGCNERCRPSSSIICYNGGYPNPNNCNKCVCPLGYGGSQCNSRPNGCGETLAASATWKEKTLELGVNDYNVRNEFMTCIYWITAPPGFQVEVQITDMFNTQCQNACPFNGIEIKRLQNVKMTNPRICCPQFNEITYRSTNNPTPIILYNRFYYTKFTIKYRYAVAFKPTSAPPISTTTIAQNSTETTDGNRTSKCRNLHTEYACSEGKKFGLCNDQSYSFQLLKYNCAETCGLCGKQANPCVDLSDRCEEIKEAGMCSSLDGMLVEYHCAETCGFCTNPM